MAIIDPDRPPLTAEELAHDSGADPAAPPLSEADKDDRDNRDGNREAIETALTRLPPG